MFYEVVRASLILFLDPPVTTTTNTQSNIPATHVSPAGTGIGYSNFGHTSNGTAPAAKVTQSTQRTNAHTVCNQQTSYTLSLLMRLLQQPESKTQKTKEGAQEVKGKVASALPGHSGETGTTGAKGSDTSKAAPKSAAAGSTTSSPASATITQSDTRDHTGGHRASAGSADNHKVGFMDKVKGEAKIISGKLGKDEKKVEEGKHLMGKA